MTRPVAARGPSGGALAGSALGRIFAAFSVLALLWGAPILAQEEEFVPEDVVGEEEEQTTDFAVVDDLLTRDEESLTVGNEALSYEPGARRDPFRSLIQQRRQRVADTPEQRPEGVAGAADRRDRGRRDLHPQRRARGPDPVPQ